MEKHYFQEGFQQEKEGKEHQKERLKLFTKKDIINHRNIQNQMVEHQ